MVRRCWVNFQCRGVLLIWIIVWQGPIALAVGAGRGCLDIFVSSIFSLFFLSLRKTARNRLNYRLRKTVKPKATSQPTQCRETWFYGLLLFSLYSFSRCTVYCVWIRDGDGWRKGGWEDRGAWGGGHIEKKTVWYG